MTQFEPRPFGKYFLTDRIAIGGMAEIYKAKTFGVDGFEKTLAIKKILANYSADKDFTTMLTDEAKLVVNLSHPNIVQIYDLGRVADDYFISMEFIDGVNLRELINRGQELNEAIPTDVCLYLMAEACKGLDYAHTKRSADGRALGIVHRDVSPHNILVSFEGEVKIVDFGIAKAAMNASQTQMGTLKGKVTYMSPEQAVGKPIDQRTDIFSCGIVLYELLTGERLFTGDSQLEVLNLIRNTYISEDSLRGKVPDAVLKILAKALAHNVNDRYQSAADMQIELTRLLYSRFNEFSPRKLSDLLRRWYGALVAQKPQAEDLPAYNTESLALSSQDQINIVHRESLDDQSQNAIAIDIGQVETEVQTELLQSQNRKVSYLTNPDPFLQDNSILSRLQRVNGKRLAVGLVLVLFSVVAGFSLYDFVRSAKYVDGADSEIETASVKLSSTPEGAKVFLNGQDSGLVTPTTLENIELKRAYELSLVKDGYDALNTTVMLDSADPLPLQFPLKAMQSGAFALTIKSEPAGAHVAVNGEDTGKVTPAELRELKTGAEHKITLSLDGYQNHVETLASGTSQDQIIDIKLLEIQGASVLLTSEPEGAKIFVNGEDSGYVTPFEISDLSVPHVVEFKLQKDGFDTALETVGLTEAAQKKIHFTLKPTPKKYAVQVSANLKGATVSVDGKALGKTPLKLELAEGKHQVQVSLKGYRPQGQSVDVKGGNKDLFFRLIPEAQVLTQTPVPQTQPVVGQPAPVTQDGQVSSQTTGRLRVDSAPRGASVIINGAKHGITPIVVSGLPKTAGLTVEVVKKGFKSWKKSLSLINDYTELNAILNAE